MTDAWHEPLEIDWRSLARQAEQLIDQAERSAVQWQWAPIDADWEVPRPLWPQTVGRDPVTGSLRSTRNQWKGIRYGYRDDGGPPVVATEYAAGPPKWLPSRQTIRVLGAEVERVVRFRYVRVHGKPVRIEPDLAYEVRRDRSGRPEEVVTRFRSESSNVRWRRERLRYSEGGQLIEVRDEGVWLDEVNDEPRHRVALIRPSYDATGALEAVDVTPLGEADTQSAPRRVWERSGRAALAAAERAVADALPDAIRTWAKRQRPGSAAYCLAILYSHVGGPSLAVGTVGELAGWGPPGSEGRLEMMWNPAEFGIFDAEPAELHSPELQAAYRTLQQAWGDDAEAHWRRLCVAAAAAIDDDIDLDITEHFVAYATDAELGDFDDNIRKLKRGRARRAAERLVG